MGQQTKKFLNVDWTVVMLYLALIFIGWLNIYSAVYTETSHSIFDFSQRYGKQMIWIGFALLFAFLILETDSKFFVTFSFIIYGFFVFLLLLVLFLGKEVNGSRSWFEIGGIALQPAEFAKLGSALALSKLLSAYDFSFNKTKSLISILLIISIPVLLIFLQNDTGSALVYTAFLLPFFREGMSGLILFFGTLTVVVSVMSLAMAPLVFLIVLLVAAYIIAFAFSRKIKEILPSIYILLASIALIAGISFLINGSKFDYYGILLIASIITGLLSVALSFWKRLPQMTLVSGIFVLALFYSLTVDFSFHNILAEHHRNRINILLGIESDPLKYGYNVNQSKIAIGSGGFFGKGFLDGTQTKFNFVPEQSTDFIFCTIGEEWGFVGSTVVIGLFIALLFKLVTLAERQRSAFSRIYGYSVASILFFHITVNIGMTIGLLPVVGIPLPFLSYGGSSLWFFTILLFIFLRLDANRFEQLQ